MSLHPKRVVTWHRVIPELATKRDFLMHLLLALAGMHARFEYYASALVDPNTTEDRNGACFVGNPSADVDLYRMIEHHQKGLEGIQDVLCHTSSETAKDVCCGSILITAFAFGSLSIGDYNNRESGFSHEDEHPSTEWLSLCRGLVGVIHEHWATLKLGRLRSMLLYDYANDDWKMYPPPRPLSVLPPLIQRSRIQSTFAQGASKALSMLRTFSKTHFSSPAASSELPLSPYQNTEDSQLDATDDYDADCGITIDKLEEIYMRILYVLHFTKSGRSCPASLDVQIDLEDAAVMFWSQMISDAFISSLDPK